MSKKIVLLILCSLSFINIIKANNNDLYYPKNLLLLSNFFSHHILLAEKSQHKLYLFENSNGIPKFIKTYQMATGKKSGDKKYKGDHRTPEGIFQLTRFIPRSELLRIHGKKGEIYGAGAFVTDYPTPYDVKTGKTGGGIWLHSTNDETRIEKGLDSRGCIVVSNNDLKEISQYIELNKTKIVVVQNLHFLKSESWFYLRNQLTTLVQNWRQSWENENFPSYSSFYDHKEFRSAVRGDYNDFTNYKKQVFSTPGNPNIKLKDLSILLSKNYATITFVQHYKSNNINDTGKKILYLGLNQFYNWKIIAEVWSKSGFSLENINQFAFRPTQRFFENSSNSGKN